MSKFREKLSSFSSYIPKTSREGGQGGGGVLKHPPSLVSLGWKLCLDQLIHKTVFNFMQNSPFGRASVHLNNE